MKLLFRILHRSRVILIFILLQLVSLALMFSHNDYQSAGLFVGSNQFFGSMYQFSARMKNFISLETQNEKLQSENARLREEINQLNMKHFDSESVVRQDYIPAKVVSNSVGQSHNYLILNKGSKDGIRPRMGVIADNGVVGKVKSCSENFSVVFSVLNPRFIFSGIVQRTGQDTIKNQGLATISWKNTLDAKTVEFINLRSDVPIREKDTIVTVGLDGVFPNKYPIGTVKRIHKTQGDQRKIEIELNADMETISHVYVVDALQKNELDSLKKANIIVEKK